MAYTAALTVIAVLACLQWSIVYATPKACKAEFSAITPKGEATERGGECYNRKKEVSC